MYDAIVAISGERAPFLTTPTSPTSGASQVAAAATAAYAVLTGLFPSRAATYQAAYDASLAAVTDATARARGVAVGNEVAAAVLAARANDGRSTPLPPFVAGSAPGAFRGPAIVGRTWPSVRPFVMTSAAQFRAPGPAALTSTAYAADFAETASLGASGSAARTPAQTTSARFHSEAPGVFWPRNVRKFMMTSGSLADNARLGAMIWVSHADAIIGCFESKYHHLAWRPFSAIALAADDGNAQTAADPAWAPFLPTPPHPEYPAAHGCASAALTQTLRRFYGTGEVSFDFTSTVSSTSQAYATTDALLSDVTIARIAGGMHFRHAMEDGKALGVKAADLVADTKFGKR